MLYMGLQDDYTDHVALGYHSVSILFWKPCLNQYIEIGYNIMKTQKLIKMRLNSNICYLISIYYIDFYFLYS